MTQAELAAFVERFRAWSVGLRPRDMPRYARSLSPSLSRDPSIVIDKLNRLHYAYSDNGRLVYRSAPQSQPTFDVTATVESHSAYEPCLSAAHLGVTALHLAYTRDLGSSTAVYERVSFDEGRTWWSPFALLTPLSLGAIKMFDNASHPIVRFDVAGAIMVRAFYSNGGIKAAVTGVGTKHTAANILSAVTDFKDGDGNLLKVQDEKFDLAPAKDGTGAWILAARLLNQDSVSFLVSMDDCHTWTLLDTNDEPEGS